MAASTPEPAHLASLRLAFPPEASGVRAVSVAIRNFLAKQGVADAELFACELCVMEASSNAVEYVDGHARALAPMAEAILTPTSVEIRVTDHSPGFVLPDRIAPPSPMSERGRGLFLIQSLMDEMRYVRGDDENVMVMLKRRTDSLARKTARSEGPGFRVPVKGVGADPGPERRPAAGPKGSIFRNPPGSDPTRVP
jgi:anti-sigma regulatory factor (Ser/Thr protein kinase)